MMSGDLLPASAGGVLLIICTLAIATAANLITLRQTNAQQTHHSRPRLRNTVSQKRGPERHRTATAPTDATSSHGATSSPKSKPATQSSNGGQSYQ
jgi:hypothetical protein